MSIYDYDEEDVRRTLFEEAKKWLKRKIKNGYEELKREAKEELTQKYLQEGEQSGEQLKIVNQILKSKKSKTLETIASELEEEEADVANIRCSSLIRPRL